MRPRDLYSGLSWERLTELLEIYPESGHFVWRVYRGGLIKAGEQAGSVGDTGYLNIKIDGHLYCAHRLMWFYVHRAWPVDRLDHISLDKLDNRISNLREASSSQNLMNNHVRAHSTTKLRGVTKHADGFGYVARIGIRGERKYLGYFRTAEAAYAAYCDAAPKVHGAFARID